MTTISLRTAGFVLLCLGSPAWALDGAHVQTTTGSQQGSFYRHKDGCFLLSVRHGGSASVTFVPESELGQGQTMRAGRVYEDTGSYDVALFELATKISACNNGWPQTYKTAMLLSDEAIGQGVSLKIVNKRGRMNRYGGTISDIGDTYLCVSYNGVHPPDGFSGSIVMFGDTAIGMVVGFGPCKSGRPGFKVLRIDSIEARLEAAGLAPNNRDFAEDMPFENGRYSGHLKNGRPHSSQGRLQLSIDWGKKGPWILQGEFRHGKPSGALTLQGPEADDGDPQQCELVFRRQKIVRGKCDIYFDYFKSDVAVDPRILRDIDRDGDSAFERAREDGSIVCKDSACQDYIGGHMQMKGRYKGQVKGGGEDGLLVGEPMSFDGISHRNLVPHGQGTFYDTGINTLCFVNCDRVVSSGPIVMSGTWVNGSLNRQGRIVMNHGGVVEGEFKYNQLVQGHVTRATANMVGMMIYGNYPVYTGPVRNGLPHGPDGREDDEFRKSRKVGEWAYGYLVNGDFWYCHKGKRHYCKKREGDCVQRTLLPQEDWMCPDG